jgi:NAD(P)H-hydrate epimerase
MYRADRLTVEGGVPGIELMERAAEGVSRAVLDLATGGPIVFLCGPGNNGGDGFAAARQLVEGDQIDPKTIAVHLLGDVRKLKGDARLAANAWLKLGEVRPLTVDAVDGAQVVVDALFGAGLQRAIEGLPAQIIKAINRSDAKIVSVDVPSGVDGDTGQVQGLAPQADRTVTFFRGKPAHRLAPGRALCGLIDCIDIGISDSVLTEITPKTYENSLNLWGSAFPRPVWDGHKYGRGHTLVFSGPLHATGAARLASHGALRAGSGLVTIASPPSAVIAHATQLTSIMIAPCKDAVALEGLLADERKNSLVVGPGNGVGERTRQFALAALKTKRPTVLDADALTSFADNPAFLFAAIGGPTVLTPHEGEFARLFGASISPDEDKLKRALSAAARSGAVVVLKGPDTVIADPDGRAAINYNAPPYLATAGSGDVLAGIIAGLMAQGMDAWEAACAGVWLHGETGRLGGRGLIAEDLPNLLPDALKRVENTLGAHD